MDTSYSGIERYRCSSRNWWMLLILGIAIFALGVLVFFYPGHTYVGLSVAFGIIILLSGILQLYFGVNTPVDQGQGWMIAGGIIEVLLGVILLFTPGLSAAVLPFFLGFWLLFRSFSLIGTISDMRAMQIPGTGWTIAMAILMVILAFMVIINPILGVGALVIWLGISFLFGGITMIVYSFRQKSLCRHFNRAEL